MSDVLYRKIEKKDYPTICRIISNSFHLEQYVKNDVLLNSFQKQYLFSCLAEATSIWVAEKDGKVIGVIMGKAKEEYGVISHLPHVFSMLYYDLLSYARAIIHNESISDFVKLHRIYGEFLKGRENEFDGVLTLFAVSEASRGLGVGKNLMLRMLNYFKENNVKSFYLFTDSTCNYGFYDSQGFERLNEKQLTVTSNQKPTSMDVFLYGYNMK